MKLLHIPPLRHLEVIPSTYDAHMCISHVAARNPEYAEYYREKSKRGDFVMLDTATFEGVETSTREYADVIDMVQPTEITLPDVYMDADATVWRSIKFAERLLTLGAGTLKGLAVVPQGHTYHAYLNSIARLARIPSVTTVCIIEETMQLYQTPRRTVISAVRRNFPNLFIHLLGVSDDLQDLYDPFVLSSVRTCDTSKLIVWGLNGYSTVPDAESRPPEIPYPGRKTLGGRMEYFQFETQDAVRVQKAKNNVKSWEEYLDVWDTRWHHSPA